MAREIDVPRLVKAQDDRWSPSDATLPAVVSEQVQRFFELGHLVTGEHALPAAQAAAIIEWTGGAYVVRASEGIQSIVRQTTGQILITLVEPMATPEDWIAVVRGYGSTDFVEGHDAGGAAKTQSTTVVSLYQSTGDKKGALDASFILEIFGPRL